jgi:hypothetical protein
VRPSNDDGFVVVSNSQIYEKLMDIDRKVDPIPATVAKHESRITQLERRADRLFGAVALIVPATTTLIGALGVWSATH